MTKLNKRFTLLAAALFMLALFLIGATVFAANGDYGVNSGATGGTSSDCNSDNTGSIPCTLNWSGYGLTFVSASNGWAYYDFDDFSCRVSIWLATGQTGARGSECDQYQPNN